jgi:hypothetical protein
VLRAYGLCVLGLLVLDACGASSPDGDPPPAGKPRDSGMSMQPADTLAVLPDTQFYACAYPEIFAQQTRWLLEQQEPLGIALMVHTGDIVDKDVAEQWEVAADALHTLDGVLPYLIVPGNHDLQATRASMMSQYFAPDQLALYDWTAESRAPDRLDNSYAIAELAGRAWLFVGVEFAPRDAVLEWAGEVLAAHADLPAVLFTHAYLDGEGRRFDRAITPHQKYHPDDYGFTPDEGINDGEDIFRKLIEPHENVKLVLSGHNIPDGTAHAQATRASGTHVQQVLANYQLCDFCPCEEVEGGGGYLRLLRFDASGMRVHVRTYSPHYDEYMNDRENEFDLDLE